MKTLNPRTVDILTKLDWPGNVRQLENMCRWLTVMASGSEVLPSDLPSELLSERKASHFDNDISWQKQLETWQNLHWPPVKPSCLPTHSQNLNVYF